MTDENLRELGKALLSHIDALMPVIERAIAGEWDRGNYINGPQFGGAVEAFRTELEKWQPHLDYSGEPMEPGEFRDNDRRPKGRDTK